MRKYLAPLGLAAVFALGVGGAFTLAGAATTATTRYVSATGNDGAACTQAAPCKSFARAADVAASGDTIEVSGSLGDQFFAGGYQGAQGVINKTLTFHGQPGNKVRAIHFGSGQFTFDGINVDAGGGNPSPAFSNGGVAFTFENGSIGNVVDEKGALVDGTGMVFDNVRFHDVVIQTNGVHSECIFAEVPEGMIVRNSTFTNCAVMDIFFVWPDWWTPLPPSYGNVVLEGNSFGDPVGSCCGIYIGGTGGPSSNKDTSMRGWTIRNNFFGDGQSVGAAVNSTICGNTGVLSNPGWGAACATPPPPTTTTTPTTTAPATTAPAPTPTVTVTTTVTTTVSDCTPDSPYATCRDQINTLQQQITDIRAWYAGAPGPVK